MKKWKKLKKNIKIDQIQKISEKNLKIDSKLHQPIYACLFAFFGGPRVLRPDLGPWPL
jgi:hypothetical protein